MLELSSLSPLIKTASDSLSCLFFGLQGTEKQAVLSGPAGGRVSRCLPAKSLATQGARVLLQASNPAVPAHFRASKLHSWMHHPPAQERCVFPTGSCQAKKHMKSLKPQTIANAYHLNKKNLGRKSPKSHFHVVAYRRILYDAPFEILSSKAIRSTILYLYIFAVHYMAWEQSYLCCVYLTITFHHHFHNIKKVLKHSQHQNKYD